MTTLEKAAELKVRSKSNAGLVVDPLDISFDDVTRDTVMIRVKIRNEGGHRSSPTSIRLESAPFGAFVPSHPLAVLPLPVLEPGESRELSVAATRPHPISLGGFAGVPPTSVRTALNGSSDEPSRQTGAGLAALLNLVRGRGISRTAATTTVAQATILPPDLWELFGKEQPHWAGNIHVFVGNRTVERHMAKALRIYSGRTNLAIFAVGGAGRREGYAFDLVGLAPDWKAALHDVTSAKTLVVGSSDQPIQKRQWVEAVAGQMLVVLAIHPPIICEDGNVKVIVTRRSCRKTAVVEFNLDPTAPGTGCHIA
jgi:hypothetical protein